MRRKAIAVIAVLGVTVAAGCGRGGSASSKPADSRSPATARPSASSSRPPTPMTQSSARAVTSELESGLAATPTVQFNSVSDQLGPVTVTLVVPYFLGLGVAADDLNATVRASMETPARSLASEVDPEAFSPGPMSIEVNAELYSRSSRMIVVALDEYSFLGGAHPNTRPGSLLVDVDTATLLNPAELVADKQARGRLDAAVEAALEARSDDLFAEWRENVDPGVFGAAAWLPDTTGLTLRFPPYELGPYAIGAVDVTLPWATLAASKVFPADSPLLSFTSEAE